MQQLMTILRLFQKRRVAFEVSSHVGFRLLVGSTGTEELSAVPCRLDAHHAVLHLLPLS
jgi:hypothetical protein